MLLLASLGEAAIVAIIGGLSRAALNAVVALVTFLISESFKSSNPVSENKPKILRRQLLER